MKNYKIWTPDGFIESDKPGIFGANKPGKIFGTLECKDGMRMKKENRIFLHSLEDAVQFGRPCKKCRPVSEEDFEEIKNLVPYDSLQEFYDRDKK